MYRKVSMKGSSDVHVWDEKEGMVICNGREEGISPQKKVFKDEVVMLEKYLKQSNRCLHCVATLERRIKDIVASRCKDCPCLRGDDCLYQNKEVVKVGSCYYSDIRKEEKMDELKGLIDVVEDDRVFSDEERDFKPEPEMWGLEKGVDMEEYYDEEFIIARVSRRTILEVFDGDDNVLDIIDSIDMEKLAYALCMYLVKDGYYDAIAETVEKQLEVEND